MTMPTISFMPVMEIAISLLAFFIGAAFVWALWPDPEMLLVRARLQSEVGQPEENVILKNLALVMEPVHKALKLGNYADWLNTKLEAAGVRMPAWHMLVVQELAIIGACFCYAQYLAMTHESANPVYLIILMAGGFMFPVFWLSGRTRSRRETVARDLPEVVDLLALCVGAGADFMTAMSRIVREFRPCPVRDELAIVLSEIRVGKRRRDALRAFATRIQTPEASTFARTLIQADRMGTGLIDALTVLSEDMRLARYHWAERYAQKAPLKMLIPLVLSLGSAMVVVAGPIIIQFLRGGVMGLAGEDYGTPPAQAQQAGQH